MESGLLTAELLSTDVQALLNEDFLSLKSDGLVDFGEVTTSDECLGDNDKMILCQNESWDPDVLLSNAVLPEINPLLELDGNLVDDYHKLLTEWESQLGPLQPNSELQFSDDAFGSNRSHDQLFDDLLRPQPVTGVPQGVPSKLEAPLPCSPRQQHPPALTSERSGRLTLGKRSLAGIVISSGPGGHFETYEGTQQFADQANSVSSCAKPVSLLRVNKYANKPYPSSSSSSSSSSSCSSSLQQQLPPPTYDTTNTYDSFNNFQIPDETYFSTSSELIDQSWSKQNTIPSSVQTLAPNSNGESKLHETSYSLLKSASRPTIIERRDETCPRETEYKGQVLEASDVDRLFEEFEASADFLDGDLSLDGEGLHDVEEASQIVAAVQNHFASSNGDSKIMEGRGPKIVPSQRIKDALPREIIESIKATSQRSRTIAIIEPVNPNRRQEVPADPKPKTEPAKTIKTETVNHSHPTVLGTRFQEAATSLNRSKQIRQMGTTVPTSQAQISLDHDYCSMGNKGTKRPRFSVPSSPHSDTLEIPAQRGWSVVNDSKQKSFINKVSSPPIVIGSSAISRPVVRVVNSRTPVSSVGQYRHGIVPTPIRLSTSTPQTNHQISVQVKSATNVNVPSPQPDQVRLRGENDPKKDSGLESGEVSDASEGQLGPDEDGLFSKVPAYLTAVNVENSDSRTVTEADDSGYDRLPAYVKGVPTVNGASAASSVSSSLQRIVVNVATKKSPSPTRSHSSRSSSREQKRNTTTADSRNAKSSRGSSDMRSPVRHSSRIRRRQNSSSSSSSRDGRRLSRSRRSLKKRSSKWRSRSRSASCSPPRYTHFRSRSPVKVGFSVEKQRQEQQQRQRREEKNRQVEERRVVYVGKISEGTTRADLRQRFEVFGPILEISLHFRDRGDNYGFVTFKYKNDAYEAIEHGNDNPAFQRVDLCFGGRRSFCKEKYSDLDYAPPSELDDGYGPGGSNNFDVLLQQARAGLKKK